MKSTPTEPTGFSVRKPTVDAGRRTVGPELRSNYELFNRNNFNIRYWSCVQRLSRLPGPSSESTELADHVQPTGCGRDGYLLNLVQATALAVAVFWMPRPQF